jgi:hypothetical protein
MNEGQDHISGLKSRKHFEAESAVPLHPILGSDNHECAEELDSLKLDLILRASKHIGPPKMVIEGWINLLELELGKFDDPDSPNYKSIMHTIRSMGRFRECMGEMSREEQEQYCIEH